MSTAALRAILCEAQWRMFTEPRTHVTSADTIIYRSRQSDCANCTMKNRCCPNTPVCKITRSVHESAMDVARRIGATEQYQRSRKERKKVEMLFAHLKRILRLDRMRMRGLSKALQLLAPARHHPAMRQ